MSDLYGDYTHIRDDNTIHYFGYGLSVGGATVHHFNIMYLTDGLVRKLGIRRSV